MLPRIICLVTRWFGHPYVSTYCVHNLHVDCRLTCKHCRAQCLCPCHARVSIPCAAS